MLHIQDFKKALSKFTTGIAVVTTTTPDQRPFGLTINAFSSLSLAPPLVLFCLTRTCRFYTNLSHQPSFTFNILNASQQALAEHFARPYQGDKWDHIEFEWGNNGCPSLKNALATIECQKHAIYPGGDHDIILGAVKHLESKQEGEPLLYFSGQYKHIDPYFKKS